LQSVSKFTFDNNVYFEFHPSFFCVKDPMSGATFLKGQHNHGLYSLSPPQLSLPSPHAFMGIQTSLDGWHSRLGHPSLRLVRQVVSQNNLALLRTKPSVVCHACQLGKSHQLPFHLSSSVFAHPLDLFSLMYGVLPLFLQLMEISTTFVLLMTSVNLFGFTLVVAKSDVITVFQKFQVHVERLFNRKIKAIQTDWGGEFRKLNLFLAKCGIAHRLSCPHHHKQNGSVERKHRHIVDTGLTLLAAASMSRKYWDEAFTTTCFLINRIPSPVLKKKKKKKSLPSLI
jgi:hypothetical protein